MINKNNLTGVILSGGRSSRMLGNDKGLISLNNKPLISYAFDAIKSKVDKLFISANKNIESYQQFGEVIEDKIIGFQGPLAGISTALSIATTPYLLVLPCDCPLINQSLIEKLIKDAEGTNADICVAYDGVFLHPTFALIKTKLKHNLSSFLKSGERKLSLWVQQNYFQSVDFSHQLKLFMNVNRPQDLEEIQANM